MFKRFIVWISQYLIWLGFGIALAGSFEQALDASKCNGGSPFWSSVAGIPFPHHYIDGFLILGVCLLIYMWCRKNDENKKLRK